MKKIIGILVGLAVLGGAVYLGNSVWAQQPIGQPAAPPAASIPPLRTRVAVINMVKILKNYKKFESFEQQFKKEQQGLVAELEKKKVALTALKNEYDRTTDAVRREQYENDMRRIQREMQDADENARKLLGKRQGDIVQQIYREIETAVQFYARSNDIEMVLHYNDAINDADLHSPANVQRKLMQLGPLMPMYFDPRMDISDAVVNMLNQRYGPGAAPATN